MNRIKKFTNELRTRIKLICYSGIALLLISCSNDDDANSVPDCGCDSETLFTIPSEEIQIPVEEQTSGLLFYKGQEDDDPYYNEDEYKNRYWIFRGTEACSICATYFIVCNESALGQEYDYLKQENVRDSIRVEFTGEVKQLCHLKPTPTSYAYGEIVIDSVEKK